MSTTTKIKEAAALILENTNNGNSLPFAEHLLVKKAIDGDLADDERGELESLYKRVSDGTYDPADKVWFWGIEGLTKARQYLCWKDLPVAFWEKVSPAEEKAMAQRIGARCKHLEHLGVLVTIASVEWFWAWFDGIDKSNHYLPLLAMTPFMWEREKPHGSVEVMFVTGLDEHYRGIIWDGEHVIKTPLPTADHAWFRSMGWEVMLHNSPHYRRHKTADWREICAYFESLRVPHDILER